LADIGDADRAPIRHPSQASHPRSLLHSQFEALEEPRPDENPIIVSIEPEPREIVRILSGLSTAENIRNH
jgi:gluconate kinase